MDFEYYLNYIDEGVLVLDGLSQVVFINDSLKNILPQLQLGENVICFDDAYKMIEPCLLEKEKEIQVQIGESVYIVHVSHRWKPNTKIKIAQIFIFTDVSNIVDLIESKKEMNLLLKHANNEVEKRNEIIYHNSLIEQENEKNRVKKKILQDLHDTLGHSLTILNALYKLAITHLPNKEESKKELRDALRITEVVLADYIALGEVYEDFQTFLIDLKEAMAKIKVDVNLFIDGVVEEYHEMNCMVFVRICQEAASNSIRHGGATRIDIHVGYQKDKIDIHIEDNGSGITHLKKGNGLIGMEERINQINGEINFGTSSFGGLGIELKVPIL